MRRLPAPIALLLTAALAACGVASSATETEAKPAEAPPPIVRTAKVETLDRSGAVTATGTLVYDTESRLSFKTGGVITSISVDDGDTFKAGQVLARVDLTELNAGVAQADAAVTLARAQYDRTKALVDKDLLASARLDEAQAGLDQALAARKAVSFNESQGQIIARRSGVVLTRMAEPGQTVAPGAPILEIGETGAGLVLRVPVSADEAATLKAGDKARLNLRGVEPAIRDSVIVRIAPKSDMATGNFDIDLAAGDASGLRSGLTGSAEIFPVVTADAKAASADMRIPALALLDARSDQGFVYVVDAQKIARRRAIETSGLEDGSVIVTRGLKPGEDVVSEGAAYVRDGQAVKIAAAEAP